MASARAAYREDLRALLPDDESLGLGITAVFGEAIAWKRVPHVYASSFPAEIVHCTFADGAQADVLCKYTAGKDYDTGGHRGGIAYEVVVYRSLLDPLALSTPAFHGDYTDPRTRDQWLFVEYLSTAVRVDEAADATVALRAAAGWIGDFQLRVERDIPPSQRPSLTTYDTAYYANWARRTARFGETWHADFPWLGRLCARFEEFLESFPVADSVIHGEFTPHNVLVDDNGIHPIDWESAAVAVGGIDVASLVEGWDEDIASSCIAAYREARWPAGAPPSADEQLDFARVYWALRWLGHAPQWREKAVAMRMKQLRASGERLELI